MARNSIATELSIVHCSATRPSWDGGLEEIHRWHVQRGIFSERGRTGYHAVIRRSGIIELGRDIRETGAHCLGYNDESLGVCLVGGVHETDVDAKGDPVPEDNFTVAQYMALRAWVEWTKYVWPTILTGGHNDFANRGCPSFDLHGWMREHFGYDDQDEIARYIERGEGDGY